MLALKILFVASMPLWSAMLQLELSSSSTPKKRQSRNIKNSKNTSLRLLQHATLQYNFVLVCDTAGKQQIQKYNA
jgi:hypothetical protein